MLTDAMEALIANRKSGLVVTGTTASFALPVAWRSTAPFKSDGTDITVIATTKSPNKEPETASRRLRYGKSNWAGNYCIEDWDLVNVWGRMCLLGTSAPFYSGFASDGIDYCADSSQIFNDSTCGTQKRFTIAVR